MTDIDGFLFLELFKILQPTVGVVAHLTNPQMWNGGNGFNLDKTRFKRNSKKFRRDMKKYPKVIHL